MIDVAEKVQIEASKKLLFVYAVVGRHCSIKMPILCMSKRSMWERQVRLLLCVKFDLIVCTCRLCSSLCLFGNLDTKYVCIECG